MLFYFTSHVLNMFRTLIYPSSGACDYSVELPHRSWFVVCWRFDAAGFEQCPSSACNTDSTQIQPHQISNTQRSENKTTDVGIVLSGKIVKTAIPYHKDAKSMCLGLLGSCHVPSPRITKRTQRFVNWICSHPR